MSSKRQSQNTQGMYHLIFPMSEGLIPLLQVIRPALLRAGFDLVRRKQLEVTDDVSIVEALGEPVRLTAGSYTNIKVTTPDDLVVAEGFLRERPRAVLAAAT